MVRSNCKKLPVVGPWGRQHLVNLKRLCWPVPFVYHTVDGVIIITWKTNRKGVVQHFVDVMPESLESYAHLEVHTLISGVYEKMLRKNTWLLLLSIDVAPIITYSLNTDLSTFFLKNFENFFFPSFLWLASSYRPEQAPPTRFPLQLCHCFFNHGRAGGVAQDQTL